jgi:hypothetical protein
MKPVALIGSAYRDFSDPDAVLVNWALWVPGGDFVGRYLA